MPQMLSAGDAMHEIPWKIVRASNLMVILPKGTPPKDGTPVTLRWFYWGIDPGFGRLRYEGVATSGLTKGDVPASSARNGGKSHLIPSFFQEYLSMYLVEKTGQEV
jgi:hypothetical protein